MEAIGHITTSTHAMRLRIRMPVFAGMSAWSGNGDPTAFGGSGPSRGIAGAGEQAWAFLVFATGGDG